MCCERGWVPTVLPVYAGAVPHIDSGRSKEDLESGERSAGAMVSERRSEADAGGPR